MAIRPIDGTWSKFVWNLGESSESLGRKFREGKACLRDLKLAVDAQPTLTPPNEWVSVEERLPEHMKDVIVLYGGGEIDIDWVDSLGDFRFDNLFGRVTHWMPLPAPPDRRPPEGEA